MTTLACLGFVGHATIVNPVSHGNFLHAIHGVRDHAAADPAADPSWPPQSFWPVEESSA